MRKAIAQALPIGTTGLLWPLLALELGLAILGIATDGVASSVLSALRLFLRF